MASFFDAANYGCRIHDVFASRTSLGPHESVNRRRCELIYKVDGSSYQIFPDRTLRLLPDCLYFIPACSRQNIFDIDVPGMAIDVIFELYGFEEEDKLIPELIQLPPNNPIRPQFERMVSLWKKRKYTCQMDAQIAFLSILSQVVSQRRQAYTGSHQFRRIQPAIDLIEQEYARAIDLDELTALCGVSGEYLRQLFRTHTGMNPLAYLRACRLRHARDMLRGGQQPVGEVARACGYEDPRYFSRLFLKEYGMTPSAARNGSVG